MSLFIGISHCSLTSSHLRWGLAEDITGSWCFCLKPLVVPTDTCHILVLIRWRKIKLDDCYTGVVDFQWLTRWRPRYTHGGVTKRASPSWAWEMVARECVYDISVRVYVSFAWPAVSLNNPTCLGPSGDPSPLWESPVYHCQIKRSIRIGGGGVRGMMKHYDLTRFGPRQALSSSYQTATAPPDWLSAEKESEGRVGG